MVPVFSDSSAWLYKHVFKPIVFAMEPEFVHNQMVKVGRLLGHLPLLPSLLSKLWAVSSPRLHSTYNGVLFPNPVGLSAGFDYDSELSRIIPSVGFGWHTFGTVTYLPYEGNPKPRLGRLPRSRALLVNKGLKNSGARAIIARHAYHHFSIPTGISIGSTNRPYQTLAAQIADILLCFKLFERAPMHHHYYELNISCPNAFGGEPFTEPQRLEWLLTGIDQLKITRPIFVKMPVDLTDQEAQALLKVIDHHHPAGVILGNLTKDHQNPAIDLQDKVTWKNRKGNLSGKPTWDRSNRLIALTRRLYPTRFTIIGTGGIFSGEDAATKLKLGADLVQLITGMIYEGPQLIGQINQYLLDNQLLDHSPQPKRRPGRHRSH